MGGHNPETVVQVQQTATQTQDVSINKDLQGTIDNLVNVLVEQAKNPATTTIVPVIIPAAQQQQQYTNADINNLLASMYYNTIAGQNQVQLSSSPVNLTSIFIAAAIVIIAIFYTRRK